MDAPNDYKNAGLMLIISGAFNALTSLVWVSILIWVCVGVIWLIPLGIGIWQVVLGIAMQGGQPKSGGKMCAILGIVTGVLTMNPLPLVLAALAMMNISKPEVAGWLEQNGQTP